jgi:hypothetical protein
LIAEALEGTRGKEKDKNAKTKLVDISRAFSANLSISS